MGKTQCIFLALLTVVLPACVAPEKQLDQQAAAYGFSRHQLQSGPFLLTVFKNGPLCNNNRQHIYIGGDGNAWIDQSHVSLNPTARESLVLDLMHQDVMSSLVLGRPCYHGQHQAAQCHPLYWTHWRYSHTIVESMVEALNQLLHSYPECRASFIGYSGGGTLAMLLAHRVDFADEVVTISGNLDVTAWADLHGYSRLQGSLNPAEHPSLPDSITQIHLSGEVDDNIPLSIVLPVLDKQPDPLVLTIPEFNHSCCWRTIWPDILQLLDTE
ncbi:MAG: alpha/beta hydrolase [Gammaproteobacteria bacterium]|nr:alpha/beta hydrolase [Gammaproteobacteria bacterium]